MKALADLIVSGRWQAVLVTFASGMLAFLFPPYSTLLVYLGAAAIVLVTLHIGVMQGLQVLALATGLVVLVYLLLGAQAVAAAVTVALLWLPSWLISVVLRQTVDLALAMKAAAALVAAALLLVFLLAGDPTQWWFERLSTFREVLEKYGMSLQDMPAEQVLQAIARLMTGVVCVSLALGMIASLLLGRWWQSLLVNPGGLREEFSRLRLGQITGLLTLGVMITAQFTVGAVSAFSAQLAMIMLVPYLFAGLAVIHSLAARAQRGGGWLVAVYVLLALLPQAGLLLAAGGLLDTWIDLRRRFERNGDKST
jgi:hypothetical protein